MASEESTFTIHVTGDETGETWHGDFTCKTRLSMRDQVRRDRIRREMLGDAGGQPDDRALSIAIIHSELSVRLTKWPSWWEQAGFGLDLEDGAVLGKVYDCAMNAEKAAKEKRDAAAKEAEEALRKEQAEVLKG